MVLSLLRLVELPGAMDGPVAQGAVAGEAQRTWRQGMLEVVADECSEDTLAIIMANSGIGAFIQILGSLLAPPLFLAWFAGVEEKSARGCWCCARHPRAVQDVASVRHSGENVRSSAVDGAFMMPWGCMLVLLSGLSF